MATSWLFLRISLLMKKSLATLFQKRCACLYTSTYVDMSVNLFSIYNPGPTTIEQYVEEVKDFSSQYGSEGSISYTALNVVGEPNIFPKFGDYTQAFLLRTYGSWWLNSASLQKPFSYCIPKDEVISQDFLEVRFKEKVYPLELNIYETYNPGAIVKVLAYSYGSAEWKIIWKSLPQIVHSQSRIFKIETKNVNFATDLYRLEFHHAHLKYYYELDAISLTGKSLLFSFQYILQSESNLNANEEIGLAETFEKVSLKAIKEYKSLANGYFDLLPSEVFNVILSYLDLMSLCIAARVSRLFYKHCYDPTLYTGLELKLYWNKVTSDMLYGLKNRCSSLQYLNLSWCGNKGKLNPASFIQFLENCGQFLKYLYLSNCSFVNNDCMKAIADFCPYLQEFQICSCRQRSLDQLGFMQISRLVELRHLDLYRTLIDKHSIIGILRSCIKLQYLGLGNCSSINNFDDIAAEIARNLRNLKSLDLWRAKTLSSVGIYLLANHCLLLNEIDIGWCLIQNFRRNTNRI
ncbi:F-box/LRR-repeat protein 4 isoform X2 [Centruroides vittatus]|uniref:F-box/LRR-repeat protein 4 isoform X2 n=1 Tax=Centruroides vittatus TaxID=120091 RepID=UPI00350FAC06